MSPRRLATVLGPLIAFLLIAGVTTAVLRGDDTDGTDFAQEPGQATEDEPFPGVDDDLDAPPGEDDVATPDDGELATPDAVDEGEDATVDDDGVDATPDDAVSASPTPEPAPTTGPAGSPVDTGDEATTSGGRQGGLPNTGTAISALGLLLLIVGGGLLWLRRSRA